MSSNALDLSRLIDRLPVRSFHVGLIALCSFLLVLDGFDTQVIGYVAPALVAEWKINRTALGPIFSAGLFGLMLGAAMFGPVADRYGRRPTLMTCVATFAVLTLLSSTSSSVTEMMAYRFLAGLGLGGAMPNAIALVAEYSPARVRGRMVTILICGFSVGAALGGFFAAWVLPVWGWRPVIQIGGALPIVMLPVMWVYLPESLRFLALKDPHHPGIVKLLGRVAPDHPVPALTAFSSGAHEETQASPKLLFTHGRTPTTLLLWIGFFMNLIVLYFLASYLPTMLHANGLALGSALRATGVYQIGGIVGAVTIGVLIDRFTPAAVIGLVMALGTAFIALIPMAQADFTMICVGTFGAGFCIVGGQIGANAFAGTVYPTAARSTGVGWALGVGRFGSVTAPLMVSALLAAHWPIENIFYAAAVPTLLAALAVFLAGLAHRRNQQATAASNLKVVQGSAALADGSSIGF